MSKKRKEGPIWHRFHSSVWAWISGPLFKDPVRFPGDGLIAYKRGHAEYFIKRNMGGKEETWIRCSSLTEAKRLLKHPDIETIYSLREKQH